MANWQIIEETVLAAGLKSMFVFHVFDCELEEHTMGIIGFENEEIRVGIMEFINSKDNFKAELQEFRISESGNLLEIGFTILEGYPDLTDDPDFNRHDAKIYNGIIVYATD